MDKVLPKELKKTLETIGRILSRDRPGDRGRARWAVDEIMSEIKRQPLNLPINVIEDLCDKWGTYMGYNEVAEKAFEIPYRIAERYSDLYRAKIV